MLKTPSIVPVGKLNAMAAAAAVIDDDDVDVVVR